MTGVGKAGETEDGVGKDREIEGGGPGAATLSIKSVQVTPSISDTQNK